MILSGMQQARDAEGILKLLSEIKPPSPSAVASLASMAAGSYARVIAQKLGPKAALELIDRMEAAVPFDELKKGEAAAPPPPAGRVAFSQVEGTIYSIAMGRHDLLESDGKPEQALKALEDALSKLPEGSRYRSPIQSKLRLAKLPGSIAPELKQERGYGGFTSLESMRGKVVIVDFTAHW